MTKEKPNYISTVWQYCNSRNQVFHKTKGNLVTDIPMVNFQVAYFMNTYKILCRLELFCLKISEFSTAVQFNSKTWGFCVQVSEYLSN